MHLPPQRKLLIVLLMLVIAGCGGSSAANPTPVPTPAPTPPPPKAVVMSIDGLRADRAALEGRLLALLPEGSRGQPRVGAGGDAPTLEERPAV